MKSLLIVGAGGYGHLVKEIAEQLDYTKIDFLDDNNVSVVGKISQLEEIEPLYDGSIIAIGNSTLRQELYGKLKRSVSLIHPKAVVSRTAIVESGCVIEANSVINTSARIENGCFVCAGAVVNHDSVVHAFSQIDCNAVVAAMAEVPAGTKVESCTVYKQK